jgi:hypothetical protein
MASQMSPEDALRFPAAISSRGVEVHDAQIGGLGEESQRRPMRVVMRDRGASEDEGVFAHLRLSCPAVDGRERSARITIAARRAEKIVRTPRRVS